MTRSPLSSAAHADAMREYAIERQQAALAGFAGRLEALSPLATLARGYSVARTPEGEVLRRRRDFHAGRRFHLRLMDGSVVAEAIEQIEDKVEER